MLRRALGIPVVLLGLALPDDQAHAANERFHLPNLWRGVDTSIFFLLEAQHLDRTGRQPRIHGAESLSRASTPGERLTQLHY
jgi:hypothetical protein